MAGQLNLVVLGKQGAGKGTQSRRLCDRYGLVHISTGDMLRAAVQNGSALGDEVRAVLDGGQLVSDDLVNRLVAERYTMPDAQAGGVLDGFPRNLAQAEALEGILVEHPVALCVSLEIDSHLVIERLSARRVCQECATTYAASDPSAISGTCEKCGGDVVQRSDDQPEAIARRLEVFERDTAPLLDFYERRSILVHVDGDQAPDDVTRAITDRLEERALV